MKHHRSRLLLKLLLVIAAAIPNAAQAQRGALTHARALDQLTDEADVIVRGHVISANVEPHPQFSNLMTVLVSLHVEETLKGSPRESLQFRQYIWDLRDQLDAARYRKGQELLLLLGPASRYGLTSPVGLEQGRFRIQRDAKGTAVAINGRANHELFHSTEARARARGIKLSARQTALLRQTKPGPVSLPDLEGAIRLFVEAK